MAWEFHLTDLQGVEIAEILNAGERKITLPHMRIPTVNFKLPLYHPLADTVLNTDTLLKCYRKDSLTGIRTLAFNGPVIVAEEVADNNAQSISVEAAGPYWRMSKRILGLTKIGQKYGTATAPIDLGLIAHGILDSANASQYTGISKGTRVATYNAHAGPYFLKVASEAITELTSTANSFEFVVQPTEPTNVSQPWPQIGKMNIAPLLGGEQQNAIFEYGSGRANVSNYSRRVDRAGILTRAIVPISGWPDSPFGGLGLRVRNATPEQTSRGLFEEVINDAGVTNNSLRDVLGDYHLSVRKNPRQVITFKPAVNARPTLFVDYNVADRVRARAVVRGSVRFDAMFRVWGVTVEIDPNGNESIELELVIP